MNRFKCFVLGRKLLKIKEELEEKKAKRLELQGELKSLMNQLKELKKMETLEPKEDEEIREIKFRRNDIYEFKN